MKQIDTLLPNFLIVGAAKSGTTGLVSNLRAHPDVFISNPSEPNFFAFDHLYQQGIESYVRLFQEGKDCRLIGEKSWRYSVKDVYPKATERIRKHLNVDQLRVVYMVREPLDRAESLFMEFVSSGENICSLDFNTAIRAQPLFLDSSRYFSQISEYRKFLPDDRIKVVFFEDYVASPRTTVQDVIRFLGADAASPLAVQSRPVNQSQGKFMDRHVLKLLRIIPGAGHIRSIMPGFLRTYLRTVLKRPLPGRPPWDAHVQENFRANLKVDVLEFLHWQGRGQDVWARFFE